MQITFRPLDIASRVAAVVLVALPIAWFVLQTGEWEAKEVSEMSHEQLLKYVQEGHNPSFLANYAWVLLLTFVYVGVVEGMAFVFRLIGRAVWPEGPESEAARRFV